MARSRKKKSQKSSWHKKARSQREVLGNPLPTLDWECPRCKRWFCRKKNGPQTHTTYCLRKFQLSASLFASGNSNHQLDADTSESPVPLADDVQETMFSTSEDSDSEIIATISSFMEPARQRNQPRNQNGMYYLC